MVDDFKHTDAGLIPHEWDASPISDLFKFKQGVQCPVEKQFKSDADGLKRFIRIIDLTDSTEPIRYISDPGESHHVKKDDLFMVRYGSPGLLGFGFKGVIANNLFRLLPKKELSTNFYYHYLSYISDKILAISGSSTMPAISFSSLNDLPIVVPPTKTEQTAIATALNDADALITALEKLIAKKKAIKQGAMQNLLKPKDGWIEKNLGKSAILKARIGWQGLTTAEYKETGEYFLITGTDFKNGFIDWQNCVYVEKLRYDQDNNIQVKSNDVLVTKDGTIGKVAFINEVPKPATLNSGVFVIRPIGNSFHPKFFYYILLSEHFAKFLGQLSAGSTINHLYQKDFVSFDFWIPKTIDEQKEISEILFDMDSEIEELDQKLAKQKQIKQGMMQVLLTGKIRLK